MKTVRKQFTPLFSGAMRNL